jgi:DNA-directed RNA polymerase subunit H (RpoH/RPB5)
MSKTKFDISKHILVPKHQKVTAEEKQSIFEKYNVTIREMPKISRKDPALKELSVKAGDLIKITRNSPTAGDFEFYRVVSDE